MLLEAELVANYASAALPLHDARLGDEFYPANLPVCVIDAVFSIGVRYEGVKNVLRRYCEATAQTHLRENHEHLPPRERQQSISDLCALYDEKGLEGMTTLFGNRGRTSTKNGILKAEAVYHFALALKKHRIEHLQDIEKGMKDEALENDVRAIPGQGSGVSLAYFWMLAGSDDLVKPDRMVVRFLETALHRDVAVAECQKLVFTAVSLLQDDHPQITPRLLDHLIWQHQRALPSHKPWSTVDIDRMIEVLSGMNEEGFVVATWPEGVQYPTYHPLVDAWRELLLRSTAQFYAYQVLREDPLGTLPDPSLVELTQSEEQLASNSLDGIRRYFALCLRGEKFGDGYIAAEFREGRMRAALQRLRELRTAMP